jgi:hypothetical protein
VAGHDCLGQFDQAAVNGGTQVRRRMGQPGAAERVAEMIDELVP